MSDEEKNNWDTKYSGDGYELHQKPSDLLVGWLDRLPSGRALDLACGTGRNSLFLAEQGYVVTAIDISPIAIEMAEKSARDKGLTINWIVADLDSYEIRGQYDLIVVSFFYINKMIVPGIISALSSGGMLLYENHMVPPSPSAETHKHRYHFKPGELRLLFKELNVLQYEEHRMDDNKGRQSYLASLVAQKE